MNDDATAIATSIQILAQSGVFDRDWYESLYPESCADGGNALVHFCNTGWQRGCRPNPYFDPAFYLARNTDVRNAAINPLVHYLIYGEAEKRWASLHFDPDWYRMAQNLPEEVCCLANLMRKADQDEVAPNPGFDPAWYREVYGSRIPPGISAFADYCLRGAAEGRHTSAAHRMLCSSPHFDQAFYSAANPSVAENGFDAAYHFCAVGWRHNLNPSAQFDAAWYRDRYRDVQQANVNPLAHFLLDGMREGRFATAQHEAQSRRQSVRSTDRASGRAEDADDYSVIQASGLFDVNYYLANYPDVRELGEDPLQHFCRFGWAEGRRPNPYFDPDWYAGTYLDKARRDNPLVDYIQVGEARSRRPIVYFDPGWYRLTYDLSDDVSSLHHYLLNRRSQEFSPNPHFDLQFYLKRHGHEIGRNRDPFSHFLRAGITGTLNPNSFFDSASYRNLFMQMDIADERVMPGGEIHGTIRREKRNPLVHFLLNREGISFADDQTVGKFHATNQSDQQEETVDAYAALQGSRRSSASART